VNACLKPVHDSRIERAYRRMLSAKTQPWRAAWCSGFIASVSVRNAMRSVEEVRELERERGLA
jgi:hypothetical protein